METRNLEEETSQKMKKVIESLGKELQNIRTGRANPNMLDHVMVNYYGSQTPLSQVGSVSVPEPQLITIVPWEKSMLSEIEKALLKSDLGITPQNNGSSIRLPIPPLNEERRKDLVKRTKKIAEDFRTSIRNIRRDAIAKLKDMGKDKVISEDDVTKSTANIQKQTDSCIVSIDKMGVDKEKELMEI